MTEAKRPATNWMDVLWLVLLVGLALLPPRREPHKQLILLAFGVLQLNERWLIARLPSRGPAYLVVLKIALATALIDHTDEIAINSYYYPIYFLPVVTAAEYFSPWATLLWTALASAAYCSYLYPAGQEFEITAENYELLKELPEAAFDARSGKHQEKGDHLTVLQVLEEVRQRDQLLIQTHHLRGGGRLHERRDHRCRQHRYRIMQAYRIRSGAVHRHGNAGCRRARC